MVKRSNRLPFAEQTEKLGGVLYHTNESKMKLINNGYLLQEKPAKTMEESKDENHRIVRQEDKEIINIIWSCGMFQRNFTGQIRRRGM